MHESEWQTRKQRIDKRLLALTSALESVRRAEALFALADEIEEWFEKVRLQVENLQPLELARAWIHSPPARSDFALSLREILFVAPQAAQIRSQLVSQDSADAPAEKLLEQIRLSIGAILLRKRQRSASS